MNKDKEITYEQLKELLFHRFIDPFNAMEMARKIGHQEGRLEYADEHINDY